MSQTAIQPSLQPHDLPSANRPNLPRDILQFMVIKNNVPLVQGNTYSGEVHVNTVAFLDDINGDVVFIWKVQDTYYMPAETADEIVQLITALDPKLPKVVRGKKTFAIRGCMKSMLERHSRNAGDFGQFKAMRDDPEVIAQVVELLREVCGPLQGAFP